MWSHSCASIQSDEYFHVWPESGSAPEQPMIVGTATYAQHSQTFPYTHGHVIAVDLHIVNYMLRALTICVDAAVLRSVLIAGTVMRKLNTFKLYYFKLVYLTKMNV